MGKPHSSVGLRLSTSTGSYLRRASAVDCIGMVLGVGGQTDARMRPHGTGETANRCTC